MDNVIVNGVAWKLDQSDVTLIIVKIIKFLRIHMFTTGLQGIHDKISLEISKEQLVEGYFNRGWLFILSGCLFRNNHLLWRLLIGWKRKAMIKLCIINNNMYSPNHLNLELIYD